MTAPAAPDLERLAGVAALERPAQAKRMLVIVNPYATTMSDRLKHLVVYALLGRYDVTAIDTQRKGHAIELVAEAARERYDVVVAFGGDGTVNEAANGLAGTGTPLTCLPGGSNNVFCKMLGIPNDVVDATEHLLALADRFEPRRIDLGIANGRRFVFACGSGLDASAAMRVDQRPKLKARGGPYYYGWVALASFYREYLRNPVRMRLECQGQGIEGITVLAQNSDPFSYFGRRPIRVCEGIAIDDGTLSVAVLRRAAQRDLAPVVTRVLTERLRASRNRQIDHFDDVLEARVSSVSTGDDGEPRPFPVEVDGDYIGVHSELDLAIDPGALTIVA